MSKQYGLIISKNKLGQPGGIKKPAIFNSDSDSDSEFVKPTGLKTTVRRQDRVLQQKAVDEDPTVFQYDELYDEMDAKRKESKLASKDIARKPKYINRLLATAEKRKRENERRIERQVQKDREAEGEEFKDKESFVTSSYRAKLEELKKLDEEEKRQEYLEAIGDVTKQGNLDGFYRHLYEQKGLYERKPDEEEVKEVETEKPPSTEKTEEKPKKEKLGSKKRKYRKRNESSDEETETNKPDAEKQLLQHLPSNIDADSDFSIDSSDEDDEKKQKDVVLPEKMEEQTEATTEQQNGVKKENLVEETSKETEEDKIEVVEPKKPKIDYWKKRTIGDVFDDSLRRYFERKSLRESGSYIRPIEILG